MSHEEMVALVRNQLRASARVLTELAATHAEFFVEAAGMLEERIQGGGRIFTCGNGGSAADAQHIAAELSGRFYLDRDALPATALTVNSSALTAIGNDFGFDQIFSRQLAGEGHEGDVLLAITTSGASANVVRAAEQARLQGIRVIGLTGARGAEFARRCDLALVVPSDDVARIQEAHITAGHLLCQLVEASLFGDETR